SSGSLYLPPAALTSLTRTICTNQFKRIVGQGLGSCRLVCEKFGRGWNPSPTFFVSAVLRKTGRYFTSFSMTSLLIVMSF
ncbi:MAG: hypothetical protein IIV99_03365, partial [Oscillospiraceae bacterium]|nr:hypothetical protein [Oscillospiraceae bacterium]